MAITGINKEFENNFLHKAITLYEEEIDGHNDSEEDIRDGKLQVYTKYINDISEGEENRCCSECRLGYCFPVRVGRCSIRAYLDTALQIIAFSITNQREDGQAGDVFYYDKKMNLIERVARKEFSFKVQCSRLFQVERVYLGHQ